MHTYFDYAHFDHKATSFPCSATLQLRRDGAEPLLTYGRRRRHQTTHAHFASWEHTYACAPTRLSHCVGNTLSPPAPAPTKNTHATCLYLHLLVHIHGCVLEPICACKQCPLWRGNAVKHMHSFNTCVVDNCACASPSAAGCSTASSSDHSCLGVQAPIVCGVS